MIKGGKSSLDNRCNRPHGHDVGQVEISDDRSAHNVTSFVLAGQIARRHDGDGVRPRYRAELILPTYEYYRHVEPEEECQIGRIVVLLEIYDGRFKSPVVLIQQLHNNNVRNFSGMTERLPAA